MYVTLELLYGTRERWKGKESDKASLKVENIRICIESC
jgi:hypothetical protein